MASNVLCLDANMDICKSKATRHALTNGDWYDVGTLYAGSNGPHKTYSAKND